MNTATTQAPGIARSALTLTAIAAICTALVALTWYATADRIEANRKAHLEASLASALGPLQFDNVLPDSAFVIAPPHELPGNDRVVAYRVTRAGKTVAILFSVTAPDGFSGPIEMLVGVDPGGHVTGVRAIAHKETAGLGDQIDIDRSDWVLVFDGTSLAAPPRSGWTISRDGGAFDQMTGASITSRAAVKAVSQVLEYTAAEHAVLFGTDSVEADE